eukprot:Gb_13123 [translate_table: standard]
MGDFNVLGSSSRHMENQALASTTNSSGSNASTTAYMLPNMDYTECRVDDLSQELLHFFNEIPNMVDPLLDESPSSEISSHAAAQYGRSNSAIAGTELVNMPSTSPGRDQVTSRNKNNKDVERNWKFSRKVSMKRQRAPIVGLSGRDDHILRERQRRDDMSYKFSMLEALLPRRPKRDRTAIVDDAINFVTEMQKTLKRLEKKLQDRNFNLWKPRAELLGFDLGCQSDIEAQNPASHITHFLQRPPSDIQSAIHQPETSPEIHVSPGIRTGDILIEITCSSRSGFMINLLAAMEELRLDVCHCNYSKKSPDILCIIVAKQRPLFLQQPLEKIVTVLQYAFS